MLDPHEQCFVQSLPDCLGFTLQCFVISERPIITRDEKEELVVDEHQRGTVFVREMHGARSQFITQRIDPLACPFSARLGALPIHRRSKLVNGALFDHQRRRENQRRKEQEHVRVVMTAHGHQRQ